MPGPIASARARLSEQAAGLNPEMYRRAEAQIDRAEAEARSRGEAYANDRAQQLQQRHRDVLTGLCEVRDAFTDLRDRGTKGHLSPDEYTAEFTALRDRQDALSRAHDDIEQGLGQLAEVEDDPVAWFDSLYEKYPNLQLPDTSI